MSSASSTGASSAHGLGTDWRVVDGVATAWFEASSLAAGAALAGRALELAPDAVVDVRATGVRVRLDAVEHAEAVSAAARETGLRPDPAVLQALGVVLESPDPSTVTPFWQRALDYASGEEGVLTDPLGRDPSLRVRRSGESRPLRQRIHLDVVRPASAVEQADLGEPSGPYGVRLADADGNEVDLVPGDAIGEDAGTSDWHAVFGAMACYRVASPEQQRDLALAAAVLADDAGFPLLVDLRPGLVVLDSGKDQGEADAHGLDVDFPALAARVQAAARELGATADPALPRLVQLFLDAADVAAVRAFWAAALGYVHDRREALTDLVDPRRLGPVLAFQEIDTSETERLRQRNRFEIELAVPGDVAQARVDAAVAAGGRVLDAGDGRWCVADPEGNELVVVAGA
ncbi:VOC family protein [Actinotalea solisilvae]|uniref:VOC family protein n=1 Tax=Actinotalea solisilvae TaxID=2072922 RepID=UPI001F293861|nr:VOC family protein [Actinotalea solisilvae]